jgi:hypothetical protein
VPIRAIGGFFLLHFLRPAGLSLEWKTCAETSGSAVGFLDSTTNWRT